MMLNWCRRSVWILSLWLISSAPALAEAQARNGKLLVTVVDQTGGVLPSAIVTVAGLEDATRRATHAPVHATDKGLATFDELAPGRYSIQAEFSGFTTGVLKDVRIRAGENRQTITLSLSTLSDVATASVDQQEAASDRQMTFGSALTREQIDALSEDPAELRAQLMAMAGDSTATIRVDSFEGQELPSKAMIKSIRITRDQFSAENHSAGGISIEVLTQPGVGPLRGSVRTGFYDSALDGRNPLQQQKAPRQNRNFGGGLSGSLLKNKASFNINMNAGNNYTTNQLYFDAGSGTVTGNTVRTVTNNTGVFGNIDYAVTKDQTLRVYVNRNGFRNDDAGVGGFNLAERAFSTKNTNTGLRVQEIGPLGRRFFMNTRLSMNWGSNRSRSVVDAITVIVPEQFTAGGAQQKGESSTKSVQLASDLDYVRGKHSMKMGMLMDGTFYRTNMTSNYLGTYTFSDLGAFQQGRPLSFTQRVGDPNIDYSNLQAGFYILDDMRLRKTLTLTAGLRYEAQTHISDYLNFGPRVGFTWAPFKGGKTTFRVSWGIFHDWLSTGTYEQSLRQDGLHQQSVNIANPSYPDPGAVAALPTDKYLLGSNMVMPRTMRLNFGVSQQLAKMQLNLTYTDGRGTDLFVGRNLNAPVDGVRPDPNFVNIIEAVSGGRSEQQNLATGVSVNFAKPSDQSNPRRWVPTRGLQIYTSYSVGRQRNDTGGPFATPSTGNLADDWGPSNEDVRHRMNFGFYSGALKNFSASISVNGSSARPLNITTGADENGDLIFNDRPAGVGRNSARTSGQWSSYGYFSYAIALGKRTINNGGGVSITSNAGILSASVTGGQSVPRYRLLLGMSVQNLTNHANYSGYSGVVTSRFFLQPVTANGERQVTFNATVSF